jgi:hypothetical protein
MKTNALFLFSPDARHVVVHLVALPTTAVSALQHNLSQSPGGITPQAFALALRDLPPQWPEDGSLVLQLNAGQPGERAWFLSDMVRSALSPSIAISVVEVLIFRISVRWDAS